MLPDEVLEREGHPCQMGDSGQYHNHTVTMGHLQCALLHGLVIRALELGTKHMNIPQSSLRGAASDPRGGRWGAKRRCGLGGGRKSPTVASCPSPSAAHLTLLGNSRPSDPTCQSMTPSRRYSLHLGPLSLSCLPLSEHSPRVISLLFKQMS